MFDAWQNDILTLVTDNPKSVLFVCKENAARSQMAEAILRHVFDGKIQAYSAGTAPSEIDPMVDEVLSEVMISAKDQKAKNLDEIDLQEVDVVITLCSDDDCPVFSGEVNRLHWELLDPRATNDIIQKKANFQEVRDELLKIMNSWLVLTRTS